MTTRKTVITTHSRHTVDGSVSDKLIKLMEAPYEKTVSVCDSETGKEIPCPDHYEIDGYEVFERTAKARGNSAMLPVPVEYIGKKFKVVRIDP
jgi:Putative transposon-encoded protein (DUF2080).